MALRRTVTLFIVTESFFLTQSRQSLPDRELVSEAVMAAASEPKSSYRVLSEHICKM